MGRPCGGKALRQHDQRPKEKRGLGGFTEWKDPSEEKLGGNSSLAYGLGTEVITKAVVVTKLRW